MRNFPTVVILICFSRRSFLIPFPTGVVRVNKTRLEPSEFRTMVDINGREWLVFVRFSLQISPTQYAYELLFVCKYRDGLRSRYVGKLDSPLPDGRIVFRRVETLHGLQLNKLAWWITNKFRAPVIGKEPGRGERAYLPQHNVRNEHGLETLKPAMFEPNDFVTLKIHGREEQAYVLARHDPVCSPAASLYVLVCVSYWKHNVFTVDATYVLPPRIQDVVRPKPCELWWVIDHRFCMTIPSLKIKLEYCPAPIEGFKRGHVVSVPGMSDDPMDRICACISNTWVMSGRVTFEVCACVPPLPLVAF